MQTRENRISIIGQSLLLVVATLLIGFLFHWSGIPGPDADQASLELSAPPVGGDFTLDSATGPVRLSNLRGQVVLVYFGYTFCPDICPTNLVQIAEALRSLQPSELERTRVLFISIDPERDDPGRLAGYVAYFHPNILGLTGTPEQLAEIAKRYGAAYRRVADSDSAFGDLIDHSAFTYVIDPNGRLVETLGHASPPETIRAAIRRAFGPES